MKKMLSLLAATVLTLAFSLSYAQSVTVKMYLLSKQGRGKSIGTISAHDSQYGLIITPRLHGLTAGEHGFHVHTYPSCRNNGMAAGAHLDPQKTNKHLGPYDSHGHLGDLPNLAVSSKGTDITPILAPRLKVSDILGHSLMIHAQRDAYVNDKPGGARIACGVIPKTSTK